MSKPTNHSPARRGDTLPVGYHAFLAEVKARIVGAAPVPYSRSTAS